MSWILLVLLTWAVVILGAEWLWDKDVIRGENSRKFVHIAINLSIAFLPFFFSWRSIQIIGCIGLGALVLIRASGLFKSIYDISRFSWGDIVGALAILGLALLEPSNVLFAVAVLHVGLADGIAALVGTKYGKSSRYTVLGYKKSIAGTLSFFIVSLLIMLVAAALTPIPGAAVLVIPLVTTLVENIGVYGVDNALIIISIAVLFTLFGI